MIEGDDCDDGHAESFCFKRHIDHDLVDAAVGVKQKTIGRSENEITQNDLTKAFDMFEEHRLSLTVRANNQIMESQ